MHFEVIADTKVVYRIPGIMWGLKGVIIKIHEEIVFLTGNVAIAGEFVLFRDHFCCNYWNFLRPHPFSAKSCCASLRILAFSAGLNKESPSPIPGKSISSSVSFMKMSSSFSRSLSSVIHF